MGLLNLVQPLMEALFSATVNVQPGLLCPLFFMGLLLGWVRRALGEVVMSLTVTSGQPWQGLKSCSPGPYSPGA
jgi:hypothetical protein